MNAPLSPRRRRLRWTAALLGVAVLSGALLGWHLVQRFRPAPYRPDERPDDITNELARDLPADAPRPKLVDVTAAAGLAAFRNFAGARTSQLPEDMGPGLAWGDFDNDGLDDLLLVSAGGALDLPAEQRPPCALYRNLGQGAFRRVETFPDLRLQGMAAAWGDYDGDGFLDLAITGYQSLILLHNDGGTGRFTRDARLPELPGFWAGAAWGDFDRDRRLDLYVCAYVEYAAQEADRGKVSDQIGTAVPYTLNPASYPGGRNALFRQNADGTFTDVALELRVQNPEGRSLGAVWHDFDQDGWLDLYVANDVPDNVFYRNLGGRFEEISHAAWVADYRSAMGLAVGDFDRDGDDDLFVTHWVAQENALYQNLWADLNTPRSGSSPAPPVSLPSPAPAASAASASPAPTSPAVPAAAASAARPRVAVRFVDIADQKGLGQIALPFVGWGCEFADLDQDGWLDLVCVNGSTLEADGPRPKALKPQESFLLWNRQGGFFHNLAPLHPGLSQPHVSRGLACADFDADGDLDLAIADLGEGVRLYRNDLAAGHWLKVRLRSRNAAGEVIGSAEGATAIAWVQGVALRRSVTGVSYLSQSSHTLHWGLGAATRLERLEVRWPAGGTNSFELPEVNTMYEIAEDDPVPRRLSLSAAAPRVATPALETSPAPPPAVSGAVPSTGAAATGSPRLRGTGDEARDARARLLKFWEVQRAAMQAMKVAQDHPAAIRLFREALVLDPAHEDSRYYLAACLAAEGQPVEALTHLATLRELNPHSHRAWTQWGTLRALSATTAAELEAAEASLARAHELNPEETGVLLVLGEVALLRGFLPVADERLAAACRTNPKAVGGFFLRGYVSWRQGDAAAAQHLLEQARTALGPDWQPRGATSEGDVKRKQHVERTPLARFWEGWDGQPDPGRAYAALAEHLAKSPR